MYRKLEGMKRMGKENGRCGEGVEAYHKGCGVAWHREVCCGIERCGMMCGVWRWSIRVVA